MHVESAGRDTIDLGDSSGVDDMVGHDLEIEAVAFRMDPEEAASAAEQDRTRTTLLDDRTEAADGFEQTRVHLLMRLISSRDRITGLARAPGTRPSFAHAR